MSTVFALTIRSLRVGLIPFPLAVLLPMLLAVGGSGCHGPAVGEGRAVGDEPDTTVLERVSAGPPVRKTLEWTTVQPGRVDAYEQTAMVAKVAGYVEEVLTDLGQPVQRGEVLVRPAIPELSDDVAQKEALVAQAEAGRRQAEAALSAARAAATSAEARIAQAQAGIGRAEGEADRWRAEAERIQTLATKGSLTAKLAEETLNQSRSSESARDEASAAVRVAEAARVEAEAQIEQAVADQVAADARHRVAEAELARAKSLLSYTEIKAPYEGVVTGRAVDTGQFVQPATGGDVRPLLTVARRDRFRVSLEIPEVEAAAVDAGPEGDPATIRGLGLPSGGHPTTITRTSWSLDPANRSLRAEIDVSASEIPLRPGAYVTVAVRLDRREDVLTLPQGALAISGGQAACCRVVEGRIVLTPVVTGLRVGSDVEIVEGLSGDETVVLTRAGSLIDGQAVEILPQAP